MVCHSSPPSPLPSGGEVIKNRLMDSALETLSQSTSLEFAFLVSNFSKQVSSDTDGLHATQTSVKHFRDISDCP